MRQYLCVDCLVTIDDDDIEAGAMYTGPRCKICREEYWDACCFHCGSLPLEEHNEGCTDPERFRLYND